MSARHHGRRDGLGRERDRLRIAQVAARLIVEHGLADWTLAKRKLGMRSLMEVIPLDATLVKGSHGLAVTPEQGPLFVTSEARLLGSDRIAAVDVCDLILRHLLD